MRYPYIRRLDPSNRKSLNLEYNKLKVNCIGYNGLTKEIFDKCNNSIYIVEDTLIDEHIGSFYGIIGSRVITMEEAKINKLDFYCKPYYTDHRLNLVYMIEFLHFSHYKEIKKEEGNFLLSELIRYCVADQNDGFTIYKAKCDGIPESYEEGLFKANFKYYGEEFDLSTDRYIKVYVRPPLMGTQQGE